MKITNKISAYDKAVELLSLRMHASRELGRKLKLRGYESSEITETITRLEELGFLNDQNYAEVYLNHLIRYKTLGFYGIKAKMMEKGIEASLAQAVLDENFSEEDELALARKFLKKQKPAARDKLAGRLKQRGFRSLVIAKLI